MVTAPREVFSITQTSKTTRGLPSRLRGLYQPSVQTASQNSQKHAMQQRMQTQPPVTWWLRYRNRSVWLLELQYALAHCADDTATTTHSQLTAERTRRMASSFR